MLGNECRDAVGCDECEKQAASEWPSDPTIGSEAGSQRLPEEGVKNPMQRKDWDNRCEQVVREAHPFSPLLQRNVPR
jgi:hypothetical protein